MTETPKFGKYYTALNTFIKQIKVHVQNNTFLFELQLGLFKINLRD